MKKSDELKQERHALVTAQTTLTAAVEARADNNEFTEDEAVEFDTRDADIKLLDTKIKRAEAVEDTARRAAAAAPPGMGLGNSEKEEHKNIKKRYSVHKAMRMMMGKETVQGVEGEMHQELSKRAKESGVQISGFAIPTEFRADGQTVTEDSGDYGANLVAENLGAPIDFLRPKPVLESLGAQFMRNLSGNVAFPTNDGGIDATWEGEISTVSATKNAYGKKTMSPNRLAATVPVSMQNLFQSSIDLERYTINEINTVVANKLDTAGINGAGTGNVPEGILNTTGTNAVVGGTNGAAPTWAHVVDMESKVYIANANSARMAYLINPGTKGKLKITPHTANDAYYLMGLTNEINGYNVGVSTLVPGNLTKGTLAGTANAAIFGDFSQLIFGQWGFYDLDLQKQAKEGIVEITVNSFFDCLVKQAKAFSVVKDWDIS